MFGTANRFDIIIANPPYGASISNEILNNLKKWYSFFDKKKNSASLFLELAVNLSKKDNGFISYIVPKSLTFSEGWRKTRDLISEQNTLLSVIDVSKAFEEVLLEQVIVCYQTQKPKKEYQFATGEGWHRNINMISRVTTELIDELDILPIYIDDEKLTIYNKMKNNSVKLSEISVTSRGLPAQKALSTKGYPILRGKNIGKYKIYRDIEKVSLAEISSRKLEWLKQPKIVSQNIVAHVTNPTDRIIIMATIDTDSYLSLDTVMNTVINDTKFDMRYILAILNSSLASWFYYWFVFNRAIRTMHFDKYYLGKLPIPKISRKKQQPLINIVDQILTIKKQDPDSETTNLESKLDELIFDLYSIAI